MRRHRLTLAVTLALISSLGVASGYYEPGDAVADFSLNDPNGNPVSLFNHQGMAVLIQIWGDC